MNILDHIKAGHYPVDNAGHALVPTRDGATAVICATDMPGARPLLGWIPTPAIARAVSREWQTNGISPLEDGNTLLPPLPRRVEVKGSLKRVGREFVVWNLSEIPSAVCEAGIEIKFTGSYDEEWPA